MDADFGIAWGDREPKYLYDTIKTACKNGDDITFSYYEARKLLIALDPMKDPHSFNLLEFGQTTGMQTRLETGCVGITSCLLGRRLTPGTLHPSHKKDCYETLAQALVVRNRWNKDQVCCDKGRKKNWRYRPRKAQVIGFYLNNLKPLEPGAKPMAADPTTGHITWNGTVPTHYSVTREQEAAAGVSDVFDYAYYDDELEAFWGANYGASYNKYAKKKPLQVEDPAHCKVYDYPAYYKKFNGKTVYCVICEGFSADDL